MRGSRPLPAGCWISRTVYILRELWCVRSPHKTSDQRRIWCRGALTPSSLSVLSTPSQVRSIPYPYPIGILPSRRRVALNRPLQSDEAPRCGVCVCCNWRPMGHYGPPHSRVQKHSPNLNRFISWSIFATISSGVFRPRSPVGPLVDYTPTPTEGHARAHGCSGRSRSTLVTGNCEKGRYRHGRMSLRSTKFFEPRYYVLVGQRETCIFFLWREQVLPPGRVSPKDTVSLLILHVC